VGLDVVELVMECERKFDISLEDWKLERMRTVGDLFELICEQLKLPFVAEPSQAVPEISSDVVSHEGLCGRNWFGFARISCRLTRMR